MIVDFEYIVFIIVVFLGIIAFIQLKKRVEKSNQISIIKNENNCINTEFNKNLEDVENYKNQKLKKIVDKRINIDNKRKIENYLNENISSLDLSDENQIINFFKKMK